MVYSKVIKQINKKNLSVSEVERKAGLGKGTITKWQTASPTIASLEAVAKVLNIKIKDIL